MDFIIVTGLSGAGKSKVLNALEDIGYYCSDNIPPQFIVQYAEILHDKSKKVDKIALVVDARGLHVFQDFFTSLKALEAENYRYKLMFIDADDRKLLNRYKEGRRRHHLAEDESYSIEKSVLRERELLAEVKEKADFVIDTSLMAPSQLKRRVVELCLQRNSDGLTIVCMSFGFKNGLPPEADLVFDLRCLPNPFYIPELKERTGLEVDVSSYVMENGASMSFYEKIYDLVQFSIPLYIEEGKSCLLIAMGCTGGKHRSVTFTERISGDLLKNGYRVNILHRDMLKVNQY